VSIERVQIEIHFIIEELFQYGYKSNIKALPRENIIQLDFADPKIRELA
jgi:hypothetical protein